MYNFCTLFDSNYFSRGITLYNSLVDSCGDFHLYIFAFDAKSFIDLTKMKLPFASIISLADFEDDKLLEVKDTRTKAEYCWTCTSSTILYCIEKYNLESCTYLDADMFFYSNPKAIFDEIGELSIGLTSHNYFKSYDQSSTSGIYCVQFVYFKNDRYGIEALTWWRNSCIDWCYARLEDGKFGDQKYLDDWTTRFNNVHVIKHNGAGLAPWNIQKYNIIDANDNLELIKEEQKNQKTENIVFFHFHALNYMIHKDNVLITPIKFFIGTDIQNKIYIPYLRKLIQVENQIDSRLFNFTFLKYPFLIRLFLPIHFLLKKKIILQKIKAIFIKSIR